MTESYAAGANCFIAKPSTMERFKAIARTLYLSVAHPELLRQLPEDISDPRYNRFRPAPDIE